MQTLCRRSCHLALGALSCAGVAVGVGCGGRVVRCEASPKSVGPHDATPHVPISGRADLISFEFPKNKIKTKKTNNVRQENFFVFVFNLLENEKCAQGPESFNSS